MNLGVKYISGQLLLLFFLLSCVPSDDIDHDISLSIYSSNLKKHQSAAVYGNDVFFVTDRRTRIYIYNLLERQFVDSIVLPSRNDKTPGGYTLYHCNQCSFGSSFYSHEDAIPLLYISQRSRTDNRCFTEAYRILRNTDNCKYSAKLVQTIYFPVASEGNSLGNVNVVFDTEMNKMFTYSRNNDTLATNYNICRISCFNIPSINEKDVFLSDDDVLYSFPINCSAVNMQGGCINNGLLFIGQGVTEPLLRIVDLNTKSLITTYNIKKQGYKFEPEGCFWYDSKVMLCSKNTIYQVKFTNK